jgi:hypothetical protein
MQTFYSLLTDRGKKNRKILGVHEGRSDGSILIVLEDNIDIIIKRGYVIDNNALEGEGEIYKVPEP